MKVYFCGFFFQEDGRVEIHKFSPVTGDNGDEWKVRTFPIPSFQVKYFLVLEATRDTNDTVNFALDDIVLSVL